MTALLILVAKSFLVAGAALLLLRATASRSAAQRSWIAHLGLGALLLLPIAAIAFPVEVTTPLLTSAAPEAPASTAAPAEPPAPEAAGGSEAATQAASFPATQAEPAGVAVASTGDWLVFAYVAPAALLLLFTLIALIRLFALRARANVLVEPHWLTALAHAQRRMGFKHGTALLTSDDLPSPMSWRLMRPVILLNSEAARSHGEAEAIIAHELAHVASLDWLKLLLSRVAVAIFWFNPLVWMLAREAHQLREEAADDAVLGADICDTDYAQLLVGVARHECRGLLLGAHGVAPGRNSLTRRVRRVLDGSSVRGPAGRGFALGVFAGAAAVATPLAAFTLVPADQGGPTGPYYTGAPDAETSLTAVVADATTSAVRAATAVALNATSAAPELPDDHVGQVLAAAEHPTITTSGTTTTITGKSGAKIVTTPTTTTITSSDGRSVVTSNGAGSVISSSGGVTIHGGHGSGQADSLMALKALGATPEYVRAIRASAPSLRNVELDQLAGMKAVGVTPDYVRDLVAAGVTGIDASSLTGARAVGVTGQYFRKLRSAGYEGSSLEDLISLQAMGVSVADVAAARRGGDASADALMRDHGDHDVDVDVDLDVDPGPGG